MSAAMTQSESTHDTNLKDAQIAQNPGDA